MHENVTLAELIEARFNRRNLLASALAASTAMACKRRTDTPRSGPPASKSGGPALTFAEVPHGLDEVLTVPKGYDAQVLLRWGDPLAPGMTPFTPQTLTAQDQAKRMGYNNDYIAFHPLPFGSGSSTRGLLSINNEYTNPSLMFPNKGTDDGAELTEEEIAIDMEAHGHTVVEVLKGPQGWAIVEDSPYNRRITATTAIEVSGPAAGHRRLKTKDDPNAKLIKGTFSNCAGGQTPWGTTLLAEENFQKYFGGTLTVSEEEANFSSCGIHPGNTTKSWHRTQQRFDVTKTPYEANRHGWVVELDPFDPDSVPVKRTALGRFKHECASCVLDESGRAVVYSGDDEHFQFLYKFVSKNRFQPKDRKANIGLLDEGTLYAARFEEDGTVDWRPLILGDGPINEENGFFDQGDVVIEARRAAKLMGATPMDRPEDVEIDPTTGRVYVMLTGNPKRSQADTANSRCPNIGGHVLELTPPKKGHHASTGGRWDILLLAGNPGVNQDGARYHPEVSDNGWLVNPDNGAFDKFGRLWLATDGANHTKGMADGLYACPVRGPERALTRRFCRLPRGAELCGPCFTPDAKTLFIAVQHPGEGSRFDSPSTRWPDFDDKLPPRPSVVAITHEADDIIGT